MARAASSVGPSHRRRIVVLLLLLLAAPAGCGQGAPGGTPAGPSGETPPEEQRPEPPPPPPYRPPATEQPPPPPATTPEGPFPIVLAHGFSGWSELGPIAYFYGVADALEAEGELVHVTQVDPYQAVAVRAQQLADQVRSFLRESGHARVNLVAHSQGGLDARYAISTLGLGAEVATLTTISTPHQGTAVADILVEAVPGPAQEVAAALLDTVGEAATGREQDMLAAMADLRTEAAEAFNRTQLDDPRVTYFSYAGASCAFCSTPVNPLLSLTYGLLRATDGDNDGLVAVSSARWGAFVATLPTDHFGEIGQPVGLTAFDHVQFYLDLVERLRADGY